MSVAHSKIQVQGRIVMGHPIKRQDMTDDKGNKLKNDDGSTKTQHFFVLAVPKGNEQDWKQTDWGQQVVSTATQGYRNGEINRPDFSWKIEDGDSQIPNKKGRKNCDTEGHTGHWIIKCTTQLNCPCFPYGKYSPLDAIQDVTTVKTGDYYLVSIDCADNTNKGAPAQTPGVYMNPQATVFIRAGQEIVSAGTVNGEELFAGLVIEGAEQPLASAPPQQSIATPQPQAATPPPVVTPAHDMVATPGNATPPPVPPVPVTEKSYNVNGQVFTESALRGAGYTDAHFTTMTAI